ncbi:MAG: acyl carrier protein [Defluviitaleaceae bacterium]|nr:acyl carrier protein [Defluviitaleaceae bacterium]
MSNMQQYVNAFMEAFGVEESAVATLKYQDVEAWDSVGHMQMISILEDVFDIMMDIDDIIDFGSFEKGKEVLAKYGVSV